jgi:type II secretory pathway pseudopilin PulG
MQPIYVKLQGTSMNNKLNSMMDHMWDGFYTGQKRMSRFQSVFDGTKGNVYDLAYTGSPAKAQTFVFHSQSKSASATIRIAYPSAASRNVVKDGKVIEYNMWDEKIRQYGPILQTKCGENRYMGVVNILEFYITSDCELKITPRDAIQTMVRMEWTLDAFFADGGTTTFMDRVAGSLGIHASTIKIVSVYEGSLIVNYEIETPGAPDLTQLYAIQEKQKQLYLTNSLNVGAPLLDITTATHTTKGVATDNLNSQILVADGTVQAGFGYTPYVITKTPTNSPDAFKKVITQNAPAEEATTISPQVTNVSNDKVGSSQTNVVTSRGSNGVFQPNVKIIVDKNGRPTKESSTGAVATTSTDGSQGTLALVVENNSSKVIVIVAVVIFFVIAALAGLRMMINKSKMALIQEAMARNDAIKNAENEISDSDKKAVQMKDMNYAEVNRESTTNMTQGNASGAKLQQYGDQYDPNQDFAIFASKNKEVGGHINLKEKMNLADNQSNGSEQSSIDIEQREKALKLKMSQRKVQRQKAAVETK